MEKNYRIVLTNGDKFVVKASGKESARKEALKRKELDRFGVHIDKIELVEMASFKDYLNKVAEAKTANMKKVVESDVDDKPETEMSKYKRKAVQGLYHFDHWEHPDGSFIQVHVRRKPFQGLHQDGSTGKRTKFDNFNDLKNHVNKVAEDADFDHNQRNSKPKRVGDEKKGVKESESFTPDYKQTSTSINTKTNPTDTMAALDFIEKRAKLINKKSDDSSTSYLYDLGQAGKISVVVMARDPKYYPKGMTEIKGPVNIVLGWLGKRGVTENADFDHGETDGKPTKMKGPFGNNTDAMSKQGRADIKQRVTNARYGDNPLEEGEDHQTMLDTLKDILNEMGADDDAIIAGIKLDHKGKQKIAGRLGVAANTVETLIASLQASLSRDEKSRMIQEEPEDGTRYSYEADSLGNITVRDAKTGGENFLQGEEAAQLADSIEKFDGKPQLQGVLRSAMEAKDLTLEGFF
jgi:hypothetical protein